jgi:protein-disulfide isomerase
MKPIRVALLLALSLPFAASIASAKAVANRDWSTAVTTTPQGTYVLGNPAAKVKLVEYLSFTCSHCADFATEAFPLLRSRYIGSGQVSFELRNAIRDRFDLVATVLSRCQGPAGVFPATETLMTKQRDWIQRAGAYETAERERLGTLPLSEALAALAEGSGMQAIMGRRGLSPAAARRCFSDQASFDRLSAIADEAWRQRRIVGTPTFLLNGHVVQDVASWQELEPLIAGALK